MAEKKKIAAEFAPPYRKAGKSEQSRSLDECLALSGGKSRKYAIFKLNRIGKTLLRTMDGQTVSVKIVEKSRKNRSISPAMTPQSPICSNCCGKTSTGRPAENCSPPSSD